MGQTYEGTLAAAGLRVAIVVSRWNEFITEWLLQGAQRALRRHGVEAGDVDVVWVPGSFEIPLATQVLAETGRYDAVIALGAVIRGATTHYELVAHGAGSGLMNASLKTGVPITLGVITTETIEQAIERAGTKAGNKGEEAALAAIEMATLVRRLRGE
ncbi:MAG: 6,7-dimethyl-8-ribityllumazine synthase [Ardenticatenaceae bacterium]|nr:6,7-dimethyl-8-ribityllumazine synthase [Ardenticatenaceae bacterium]